VTHLTVFGNVLVEFNHAKGKDSNPTPQAFNHGSPLTFRGMRKIIGHCPPRSKRLQQGQTITKTDCAIRFGNIPWPTRAIANPDEAVPCKPPQRLS
jgi:hypothetical protein